MGNRVKLAFLSSNFYGNHEVFLSFFQELTYKKIEAQHAQNLKTLKEKYQVKILWKIRNEESVEPQLRYEIPSMSYRLYVLDQKYTKEALKYKIKFCSFFLQFKG